MYGKEPSAAFRAWQKFSQEVPVFDVGKLCQGGALSTLSDAEIAAYDAPFPDETFKSAARIFPTLYPDGENDPSNIANKKAWEILAGFTKPFLCAFSDGDPISAGGERAFIGKVPGTANQPHTTIVGGGHFVQEDKGDELAGVINDFMAATPK
jgi:haloalkane dehalogenase